MDAERQKRLEATTRYDPVEVEARVLAGWLEGGYFHPDIDEGDGASAFSIAIRRRTSPGRCTWVTRSTARSRMPSSPQPHARQAHAVAFGTDHAGIATQSVVEKALRGKGISRHEIGREEFVKRVWEWREQYGSTIVEQFKRLGASCDYSDERFTLDDGYARAVYDVFVALYEKGYVYRDNYLVNWDPGSRSAISDLEVENREITDTLYSIDYPVEGSDEVLTVATVRPETMLADTAVAVNPGDERYSRLVGQACVLPLVGRRLPIIADEYVDPEFGTGALKITPGHDPNDFEIGRKHGLDEITVIGEDGRMSDAAGEGYAGLPAAAAQEAVVAALRAEGRLRAEEPYRHAVPFSHRSGERVEPLISLQWFMRMDELAAPAIEVVERGGVRFTPERWGRVYLDWMRNLRPWCISRQLWWGHRLPVYYCEECSEVTVATEVPGSCPACGGSMRQDEDVLDTWFSSALWPFAVLGWPDDTPQLRAFYPTSVLVTARDIIFLWVARMVMMGLEFPGDIPFADVYITSVIQAPDGRRMSKSLGTGIDPLDEIGEHGADAVRFGLYAMSSTQDVRYSAAKVRQGGDLANKMWNASRLVLLNAGDATPEASPVQIEDRWILSRLERTVESITAKLDAFDFSHAALELYDFFWSELCDWYLEIVKPRLYEGEPEVAANLLAVIERVLALAHPMLPFVTEAIWSELPGHEGPLVVAPFPIADKTRIDGEAEATLERDIELTRALRRWRDVAGVPAGAMLSARVSDGVQPHELVARLARLELDGADGEALASVGPVEILVSGEIDVERAREGIEARRTALRAEVERAERKLANGGFVAKAPPELVESEREKIERHRAELEELGG